MRKIADLPDPKGWTRKVGDVEKPCMDPSHNPPMHIFLEPGIYEHECPSCHMITRFTVPYVTYQDGPR